MTPAQWKRLQELFDCAANGDDLQRAEAVQAAAAEGPLVRKELLELLDAHQRQQDFLESPGAQPESEPVTAGVAGSRIGPYVIAGLIAAGGMGAVYEAVEEPLGRRVAIKLLRTLGIGPSAVRRFEREARVLAMLKHPGIASIYHFGVHREEGGAEPGRRAGLLQPYIAMEYIANARPITRYAADERLSQQDRLKAFVQACDAIHHGHQRAIIHRDLKPGNILVDGDGVVKIIDFGIARIADESGDYEHRHTMEGRLFGTLQYMSPEQCLTEAGGVDFRSDVYSLGAVLFELMCGRPPLDLHGLDLTAAIRTIMTTDSPRPSMLDRSVSADLEAVILKALAREVRHRYQSVSELAQDLRRVIAGEPVSARPPSMRSRTRAIMRKHRATAIAVMAVAGVLVVSSVAGAWLAIRADTRARAAVRAQQAAAEQLVRTQRSVEFLRGALASANPLLSGRIPSQLEAGTFEPWADWRATSWAYAGQPGMAATVVDVLTAAGQRLPATFSDDPASRARLADTLGWTLFRLRAFDKAEPLLREAVAAHREAVGGDHPDTIAAMLHLGELLDGTGSSQEGRQWFELARERAVVAFGPHDARTLRIVSMLAWCLQFNLEEHATAVRLLEESYNGACAAGAEREAPTLELAVRLAVARHAAGDVAGANQLARHAHEVLCSVVGASDPRTATAALEWARILSGTTEGCEQAAELLRSAATARSQVFGPQSLERAQALSWLGRVLEKAGKIDEAIAAKREHAAIALRMLGAQDFEARNARLDLARVLVRHSAAGDQEGVQLARQLVSESPDPRSAEDDVVVVARVLIADDLRSRGLIAEAIRAAEGLFEDLSSKDTEGRPQRRLDVHVRLVEWLLDAGREEEARRRVEQLEAWSLQPRREETVTVAARQAAIRLAQRCIERQGK